MKTQVIKRCPRCNAVGRWGHEICIWTRDGRKWRDTGVSLNEFLHREFGCGYDGQYFKTLKEYAEDGTDEEESHGSQET